MKKKLFSILMAVAMLATFMPSMAFATSNAKAGAAVKVMVVTAKKSGTKAVKLSWTKVAGAKSYVVKSGSKKVTVSKKTNYTVKKIGKKKVKKNQKLTLSVQACSDAKGKKVIKGVLTNKATYKVGAKNAKVAANKQMQVMVGEKASMKAKGAKFYYSDNTAAKVAGGNVTGVLEGKANVYAVAADGTNVKCAVKVVSAGFKVTFDNGSGSNEISLQDGTKKALDPVRVKKGEKLEKPEGITSTVDGQPSSVLKYYKDKDFTTEWNFDEVLTKDETVFVTTEKAWIVTFDMNGSTKEGPKQQIVEENLCVKRPLNPEYTDDSKMLKTWTIESGESSTVFDFATPIVQDVKLYAQWSTPCTVTFYDTDGKTILGTKKIGQGGNYEFINLPADTYDFGYCGWGTIIGDLSSAVTISDTTDVDISLYALTKPKYDVKFMNGNEIVDTQRIVEGEDNYVYPDLPNNKENKIYVGWGTTDNVVTSCQNKQDAIDGDTVLYAEWVLPEKLKMSNNTCLILVDNIKFEGAYYDGVAHAGGCKIDTGVPYDDGISAELAYKSLKLAGQSTNNWNSIMGWQRAYGVRFKNANTSICANWGSTNETAVSVTHKTDEPNVMIFSKDKVVVNGSDIGAPTTGSAVLPEGSTFHIGGWTTDSKDTVSIGLKIWSFKMTKGDECIRDMVPCLNLATMKYGMMDLQHDNKFYGNKTGSGTDFYEFTTDEEESNIGH